MSNIAWSEQELANAAKRVAESMLTSFPSPSECEHVFSDDFEHSMAIIGTAILTPVTFGLNNTPEITAFLFSEVLCGETISLTPASVILYALILPFVTLTAVCMLQTLLNLVVHPAISFLICFVTYIAAAYFPIEWLIGNGAMVMRYQLFDANGLSYRKELVFTLLLLLLSIGAGYLLIQRKDLISLEK